MTSEWGSAKAKAMTILEPCLWARPSLNGARTILEPCLWARLSLNRARTILEPCLWARLWLNMLWARPGLKPGIRLIVRLWVRH